MDPQKHIMISQFNILLQGVKRLKALRRKLDRLENDQMKYANRCDLNLKPLETSAMKIKATMFDIASNIL